MKRKSKVTLLCFCLVLLLQSCKREKEFIFPDIKSLNEAVYCSVTLVPKDVYLVYSPIPGMIENIFVEEGDTVVFDQPLFQVRDIAAQYNTQSGRLNVDLAQFNANSQSKILLEIQKELDIAEAQLKNDSILFTKQQNLWAKNIGSKNELDQRKLAFTISGEKLSALKSRYKQTQKELEIRLAQSEVQLKNLKSTQEDYLIKSKLNGRIYELSKEVGELVSLQEPLAEIGSRNSFIIEMEVDEVDIAKIKIGQQVFVTLEAFGDKVFKASLSNINPKMDVRSKSFEVEAIFDEAPAPLYPGLTGEANIHITTRENVLVLPSSYINKNSEVMTEEGNIKVTTGLKTLKYTEIESGIEDSTKIYLSK